MTFFVVPSGWAESPSGWSQSPVVQRVAPREHKPGRFIANGTMQSIRLDPADPFSMSHCHVRLFRCYWAHVTELTSKMILGRVAKKEAGQCEASQGWMRGAGEYSISLEWCRNWYLTVVASYSGLVSEFIFFLSASCSLSPSRVQLWLAWAQSSGLRFIKPELLKARPKPRLPGQAGLSHH